MSRYALLDYFAFGASAGETARKRFRRDFIQETRDAEHWKRERAGIRLTASHPVACSAMPGVDVIITAWRDAYRFRPLHSISPHFSIYHTLSMQLPKKVPATALS